jgi:hypothetical protein
MPLKQVSKNKFNFEDSRVKKQKERQAQLNALAEKKGKGQLKLEDIDEKLDIAIEILRELVK